MDKDQDEYMTAEDLRNRLYHSLRDKGLVNSMKSQLRTSLVSELKQSVRGKLSVSDLQVPESGSLLHRASNSLVADHLRSCKYDYTYSVFMPECGLDKSKLVSNDDLLQLLKISPQSRLFRKMTSDSHEKLRKGFIWQLLSELSALHSQSCQTASTQTDFIKVSTVSTLDEKMNVLDDLFSSRREEQYRTGATALEDRLFAFQRQLEERFRTELKLEVSRVKEDEVARIRLAEKENFRKELDKARKEMERTYQSKFDALVIRERNATERIQREQEMQEKEIYNQRQSILQEIEAVRVREAQIKHDEETYGRTRSLTTERTKAQEQELRRRDQELRKKEVEFDQRLTNEMTKFKTEYQAKFIERAQNIEIREGTLREPASDQRKPHNVAPRQNSTPYTTAPNTGPYIHPHNHQYVVQPTPAIAQQPLGVPIAQQPLGIPIVHHPGPAYPAPGQPIPDAYIYSRQTAPPNPMLVPTGQVGPLYNGQGAPHSQKPPQAYQQENERRVGEDQARIDDLKSENRDKAARLNELETQLHEARHLEVNATRHNEFLNAKLRDMSDYASMRDQNITYRSEMEQLKTRMAEIMQLNERERIRQEEMLRELRRPTSVADYAERDRDGGRPDRMGYDYHRSPRERRYYDETDKNQALFRQFEQQTLHMKEMNQELVDVKQTLAQSQKALSNEVYRKPPKDDDTSRLVSFNLPLHSARSPTLSEDDSTADLSQGRRKARSRSRNSSKSKGYDGNDIYNDVDIEDFTTPRISTDFTTDGEESSNNNSAEIIAETKYRMKSLEKEAQNLEKAYIDFHCQLTNPSSVPSIPDVGRHSLRSSGSQHRDSRSGSKGRHGPSPTASPIASRPLSSTPYHEAHGSSAGDADVSTDSLQELRGSSSRSKKPLSGQDPVPKFSLSDMSDDEQPHSGQERVERPRPITVDDLEARPGSPSIMVVPGEGSSDGFSARDIASQDPIKEPDSTIDSRPPAPVIDTRPPSKLPPLSLDSAWKPPTLDSAWKPELPKLEAPQPEAPSWEDQQRAREEERRGREQEAWDREQRELVQLQADRQQEGSRKVEAEPTDQQSEKSDQIDPVMLQYMADIQNKVTQQKGAPVEKESEKTASQGDDDLSLTEDKSDSATHDDFDW